MAKKERKTKTEKKKKKEKERKTFRLHPKTGRVMRRFPE
jgi:hypothetical protein